MALRDLSKNTQPSEVFIPYEELNYTQQAVVDFWALGGFITDMEDSDKPIKRQNVQWLADQLQITRQAIYASRDSVPNFWDLVSSRRAQLSSQQRLVRVHQAWYLKAAAGSWQHLDAYLRNFDPNYKDANFKLGEGMGKGLADLVQQVRKREQAERKIEPIDGEVIDAATGQPDQLPN